MFEIPERCPKCGYKLTYSSTKIDLYCQNFEKCPAQILGRLKYFTQRNLANIVGLSEKTLQKFIQEYSVEDIFDLYDLPLSEISQSSNFGDKSIENLQKSIHDSKLIEDYKLLAGLGIEGVGAEVSKLVCRYLQIL
jgi:DNA ligase (NAD+)